MPQLLAQEDDTVAQALEDDTGAQAPGTTSSQVTLVRFDAARKRQRKSSPFDCFSKAYARIQKAQGRTSFNLISNIDEREECQNAWAGLSLVEKKQYEEESKATLSAAEKRIVESCAVPGRSEGAGLPVVVPLERREVVPAASRDKFTMPAELRLIGTQGQI